MKTATIQISNTSATVSSCIPITRGLVGSKIRLIFTTPDWDALTKTAVFRCGDVTKDVVDVTDEVTIPAEVVSQPGESLLVGIYGTDGNSIVIPTLWADLGRVRAGAAPSGDTTTVSTLPVWAQIQGAMGSLQDLNTDAKDTLVAAVNEALAKGSSPALVYESVDAYLKAHPVQARPGASAYEIAKTHGFQGTQAQWLASLKGEAGYTPVKGADYLTDGDWAEIEEYLIAQLGKRNQLAPEFAATTDDCTDPAQLYVLPDGYLYAYGTSDEAGYTNIVPTSQAIDGEGIFNETGYMDGYYASSVSPYYGADAACVLTGWIPHIYSGSVAPQTLYIKGVTIDVTNSHCRIQLSPDKTSINGAQGTSISQYYVVEELDPQYYRLTPVFRDNGDSEIHSYFPDSSGYIRFSLLGTGENLIITFNEPIEAASGLGWKNTGVAFVPADYEDRILALEQDQDLCTSQLVSLTQKTASVETRVAALEEVPAGQIPAYVDTAATDLALQLLAGQTADSLTFLAASDAHENYTAASTATDAGIVHAGQAMKQIRDMVSLDFCAYLGDYIGESSGSGTVSDTDNGKRCISLVNQALAAAFNGGYQIRTPGNHDVMSDEADSSLNAETLYPLIGRHSTITAPAGARAAGFGYLDFQDRKVRVFALNTCDFGDFPLHGESPELNHNVCRISPTQLRWITETLEDLSTKEDADSWSVLILCHHPLDWVSSSATVSNGGVTLQLGIDAALTLFAAYNAGGEGSVTMDDSTISYDFTGVTPGRVIAQFHGHTHNLCTGQIGAGTPFWRIAVPNLCNGRENEYGNPWHDAVTYPKSPDSPEDTAFCAITIDLSNRRIHAYCYGAGVHREIAY